MTITIKPIIEHIAIGTVVGLTVSKIITRWSDRKFENIDVSPMTEFTIKVNDRHQENIDRIEKRIFDDPILSFYLDPNIPQDEKLARLKKAINDNEK